MFNLFSILLMIFLILMIFFRIPNDSTGLTNFGTSNNLFNISSSSDKFLNSLIFIGVLLYFGIAIQLNLMSN